MTSLPDTQLLDAELSGGWLRLYLNDERTRNALTEQLSGELKALLQAVRNDRSIRVISLRGRHGVFCSGGDLKAFARLQQMPENQAREAALTSSLEGAELFSLVHTAPQIVVALIEGAAMAGGLGMACAADYVYALTDTRLAFSETRLGLTPAQITPYVLNRTGVRTGSHLLLTGSSFDAHAALEYGLVDAVADSVEGLERLEQQLIRQVLPCAPGAVAMTKRVIAEAAGFDHDAFQRRAAEYFADCVTGAEGQEGMRAFFSKQRPHWHE